MTVSSDPQYQALARGAAAKLGGGSNLTRAILGQWQCELGAGDAYPPARNNPGNLARGFASGLGYPFTIGYPNPQPGNPIVTFRSPNDGASAYVKGLATFSRYAAARTAARADDGAGFLRAVTSAGWGTSASCALSVYGSTPASSGPTANLSGAGGGAPPIDVHGWDVYPIPSDRLADSGVCPAGWKRAAVDPGVMNNLFGVFGSPTGPGGLLPGWTPLSGVDGVTTANACVRNAIGVGSVTGQELNKVVPDVAGAIAGLPAALAGVAGTLAVNGAILAVVVGLGYLGVRSIITAPGQIGR